MPMRAQVLISGKVQGVFFRSFIRSRAALLNVRGWTRNTQEGAVEAALEGEKEDIEKVIAACREGPTGAMVTDVKVEWTEPNDGFEGFEIR